MRSEYIENGEYDNVQVCIKKIDELKHSLQSRKKREIESRQITEISNLHSSYQIEIDKANSDWNSRIQQFEEKYQKNEESINERQMKEMEDLYSSLETKFNQEAKSSKDYLLFEQQEQQLVKLQQFKEAGVTRKKKEQQRQRDIDQWNKEKNDKIKVQAVQKSKKHLNERNAFKRKYEIELELLKKQKNDELMRIEKKFKNKKLELDIQQKNEMNVTDKDFTNRVKNIKIDNNANSTSGSYHNRLNANQQNTNIKQIISNQEEQKNDDAYLNQNINNSEDHENEGNQMNNNIEKGEGEEEGEAENEEEEEAK